MNRYIMPRHTDLAHIDEDVAREIVNIGLARNGWNGWERLQELAARERGLLPVPGYREGEGLPDVILRDARRAGFTRYTDTPMTETGASAYAVCVGLGLLSANDRDGRYYLTAQGTAYLDSRNLS